MANPAVSSKFNTYYHCNIIHHTPLASYHKYTSHSKSLPHSPDATNDVAHRESRSPLDTSDTTSFCLPIAHPDEEVEERTR